MLCVRQDKRGVQKVLNCLKGPCSTSSPPPGALADGVGKLVELQVHSRASWEVGEALCFRDVVLHLFQVR